MVASRRIRRMSPRRPALRSPGLLRFGLGDAMDWSFPLGTGWDAEAISVCPATVMCSFVCGIRGVMPAYFPHPRHGTAGIDPDAPSSNTGHASRCVFLTRWESTCRNAVWDAAAGVPTCCAFPDRNRSRVVRFRGGELRENKPDVSRFPPIPGGRTRKRRRKSYRRVPRIPLCSPAGRLGH
ncbi:hypothetical protein Poly24_28300 [Rosistilla carotiformis]|uniref:Uncharacterized protein n=1 Tax=Rosistilla carotiformis TaxID=2528017 RepID=A0A518JUE7_9BACT|nr:hypothetical protein Poly24_28300 [Rosistilla carotiformis]